MRSALFTLLTGPACVLAVAFTLLITGAGRAHAEQTIGLHTYTRHQPAGVEAADSYWAGQKKLWNDRTWGAYYRADSGLTLGAYCNSFSRTERNVAPTGLRADIQQSRCNVTTYVGWTVEAHPLPNAAPDLRVALTPVVMHGYGANRPGFTVGGARLVAAPIPSLAWGPVRLSLVGPHEYHLSLEARFGK